MEKFFADLQGAPFQNALARLEEERDIKDNLFDIYRRIYWFEQLDSIHPYPGIKNVLSELKSRAFKLGIVTSKFHDSLFEGRSIGCIYELRKAGISDIFSTIIGLEDVKRHKPYPDGINLAMRQLDSKPEETLFVGDSAADISAAQNAGCRSCYATWGTEVPLPGHLQPHFTVKTPLDLLQLNCLA